MWGYVWLSTGLGSRGGGLHDFAIRPFRHFSLSAVMISVHGAIEVMYSSFFHFIDNIKSKLNLPYLAYYILQPFTVLYLWELDSLKGFESKCFEFQYAGPFASETYRRCIVSMILVLVFCVKYSVDFMHALVFCLPRQILDIISTNGLMCAVVTTEELRGQCYCEPSVKVTKLIRKTVCVVISLLHVFEGEGGGVGQ
jgi:hypothetical protein